MKTNNKSFEKYKQITIHIKQYAFVKKAVCSGLVEKIKKATRSVV
ncbi:hypothetical protein FUAX_32250 [Fulvitalea axinellae]|uniref:Transposase n=1 Tax=Fulvitalea axinellae TaxID=1182444 RepID=A0AAU9D4A1_9BACT|nr:hypothetical protein FUAX_32250 [Fulvitalea axinellae]